MFKLTLETPIGQSPEKYSSEQANLELAYGTYFAFLWVFFRLLDHHYSQILYGICLFPLLYILWSINQRSMRKGVWLQHIEDKGIWVEPWKAKFTKRARIIISFETDTLRSVEQTVSDGTDCIRLSYTRSIPPFRRGDPVRLVDTVIDMPYRAEDRQDVEERLIPFLQSKIRPML